MSSLADAIGIKPPSLSVILQPTHQAGASLKTLRAFCKLAGIRLGTILDGAQGEDLGDHFVVSGVRQLEMPVFGKVAGRFGIPPNVLRALDALDLQPGESETIDENVAAEILFLLRGAVEGAEGALRRHRAARAAIAASQGASAMPRSAVTEAPRIMVPPRSGPSGRKETMPAVAETPRKKKRK